MIRYVSAVAVIVCLHAPNASAQMASAEMSELTVKIASADVHRFPTIAAPVIGSVRSGTVIEVRRNLGSWVEVPWPQGERGLAFIHVNAGTIARRAADPNRPAPAPTAAAANGGSAASPAMGTSAGSSTPTVLGSAVSHPHSGRQLYIMLPSHSVGFGGLISTSAPGFGGTVRAWSGHRLGVQVEASRHTLHSADAAGQINTFELAPSALFSLPGLATETVWLRPYAAGGISWRRASWSALAPLPEAGLPTNSMGFHAFGGLETTLPGMPQFALGVDVGYQKWRTTFGTFEPNKVRFSLSGHWYIK